MSDAESRQIGTEMLRDRLLDLAAERGRGKTFCPSEVARALGAEDWRRLMPQVREVAEGLRWRGKLRVFQGGDEKSSVHVAGPIRLGL